MGYTRSWRWYPGNLTEVFGSVGFPPYSSTEPNLEPGGDSRSTRRTDRINVSTENDLGWFFSSLQSIAAPRLSGITCAGSFVIL